MIEALKAMGDHLPGVDTPCLNELQQLLRTKVPAGHQAASDLLMTHTATPLYARNLNELARPQVVHVADNATRLQHGNHLSHSVHIAAGNNNAIDALTVGVVQNLLYDIAFAIVNNLRCSVLESQIAAALA